MFDVVVRMCVVQSWMIHTEQKLSAEFSSRTKYQNEMKRRARTPEKAKRTMEGRLQSPGPARVIDTPSRMYPISDFVEELAQKMFQAEWVSDRLLSKLERNFHNE